MSSRDWFRKTSWAASDQEDFEARFKRTRRASRAQYLRIQAVHLADAGLHAEALELLDRLLSDYPEQFELAQTYCQRAASYEATGRVEDAVEAFRESMAAEEDLPNVQTRTRFEFPMLVARHRLRDLYDQALKGIEQASDSATFAIDRFQLSAAQALILDDLGERAGARSCAGVALEAASAVHSGFTRHPTVGLVSQTDPLLVDLRRLAE